MARKIDWEGVKEDYLLCKDSISLKEFAKKHDVKYSTLRSRKNREKWDDVATDDATKKKNVATKKNKETTSNRSKKRSGNPNPVKQFTKRNKAAEKHGFFSKYLPDETMEIVEEIKIKKSIDILWENIQIQYAAIIRAQKIMYVEDAYDMTKELKKDKTVTGDMSSMHEEEYEIQFAWDKQATFLKAQSRAMSELRSMIKQYDELCKTDLATEEQKLRIKKLKVDIEKVEGNEEELNKLDKLIEGINNAAKQ